MREVLDIAVKPFFT